MAQQTVFRSCPICEASCGLTITADRESRAVISIKGNPDDPRSHGYVCVKSQAIEALWHDPHRLRAPVRRTQQGWQEIGWDEAMDLAAKGLNAVREKHGKDAVALYVGNPVGHNAGALVYMQLFIAMVNTERFFSAGSVDQQPQNLVSQLLFGDMWFFPVPDIDRTDFFLCMGANPLVSQGSLMSAPDLPSCFAALRTRGGKLVVVDPRRSETAAVADQHLFIRPGSDAFLLFAFVRELFQTGRVDPGHLAPFTRGIDELRQLAEPFTPEATAELTGVSAAVLRQLVSDFCAARRPLLYTRIGLCTQRFGSLASWLGVVINVLTGRLDAPGGMLFPRPATGQTKPTGQVTPPPMGRFRSRVRGVPEFGGMLPAALLAEEILEAGNESAHALICLAGNPVLSVPNGRKLRGALEQLDFMVAIDIYINETTACADLILPTSPALETSNYDFMFSSTATRNFANYSPAVFAPEGKAHAYWEVMTDLVARINGMALEQLDDMMLDGLLGHLAMASGLPDSASIKAAIGAERGPDRLLDAMLRAGPYGDKFAGGEGLSLAKLKAVPHALDLGPLQSRLPGMLRTTGGELQLVQEVFVTDIARLQAELGRAPSGKLLLIGRRHIRDMNSWLHNLAPYAKGSPRCSLRVHPQDASRHGLTEGGEAWIDTATGSVKAPVEISTEMMPGVVSLPHGFGHQYADTGQPLAREKQPGPSCNDLIDEGLLDLPSGTSVVNGVEVEIRAA